MSYDSVPPPDSTTLADIATPVDVSARSTSGRTMVLALLGAAVVLAAVVIGIGWFVGAIAHSEAGFCGRGSAPCTSLSANSVEEYAGVDLPDGATITEGYYLDWTTSMVRTETPEEARFSAVVRLPEGAEPLTLGSLYGDAGAGDAGAGDAGAGDAGASDGGGADQVPADVVSRWEEELDDIVYSSRLDDNDPTDPLVRTVLRGVDGSGRLVYEFTAVPAARAGER
ncbi:hypothetical protein B0I08_10310 [Glaciihabitans tibetensis]|uniref:Uncharacterized protein n=1 Tax=Glaciihabitans tibetensis TaxID=1266600 RepID=A0A2T0VF58_9MICO|nr:hypothetical protein [Glaciihabitans tibetensis]PRY68806.1 hypothetical protein B0I08_10310 [Glaciihabitans tibetensis]